MRSLILLNFLFLSVIGRPQTDSISQRIFLVGDAGQPDANRKIPVLDWLKKNVDWTDPKNVFIFLGDNIYPDGMPAQGHPDYNVTKFAIDYQINLIKGTKAKAFFVPGNHDWRGGKMGGWQRAMNQVNYINSLQDSSIQAWPLNGCPGPIPVELNDKVVVVFVDSQWFLYVHEKPGPESSCEARTIDEFVAELKDIAETHPNQLLLLAMHHPMYTYGVHGGAFPLRTHIFPFAEAIPGLYIPLPILGSVYPIARGVFGNLQDTYHPLYRTMISEIEKVLKDHPNAIQAAGHEHSLQLIVKDSIPYIVSGSASKLTRLRKGKYSLFSVLEYGFSMLEIRKSGKTEVMYYTLRSESLSDPVFTHQLKTITQITPVSMLDTLRDLPEFISTSANQDIKSSIGRRLLIGENYRNEWNTEVRVQVLDITKEFDGLKPARQKGGRQSRTLFLEDKNGKEWTLRSIELFPLTPIPSELRQAQVASHKAVSGSYPYASLSVTTLAQAAGVTNTRRKLVYVPDDPRLERFRVNFKNTLAILEEEQPFSYRKADNTNDLVLKLAKNNSDIVDQVKVLKARLLDNFVMDFDRHDDQWSWAFVEKGSQKTYYPIPKDHDQAFFVSQGIIPWFARKPWLVPEIQGFRSKAHNVKTFNKQARNFDRYFLNQLSEDEWSRQIDTFLSRMTDTAIDISMKRQPNEILSFSAVKIANTLKEKKKFFKDDMLRYYKFLSKAVNIVGSDQRDLYSVTEEQNGLVRVVVKRMDTAGKALASIYDRSFDPSITKELRIYGLAGKDSFIVSNTGKIKLRLIGGAGNDYFVGENIKGKVLVYDASFEENRFSGSGFRKKVSLDPDINLYNRNEFKYNTITPGVIVEYNRDDGILAGIRSQLTLHGFRKEPFASRHVIEARYAAKTESYTFKYFGEFTKFISSYDVVITADINEPVYRTNYFGTGNNSEIDDQHPDKTKYYRARYEKGELSVSLRRQLQSWMRISIGPAFRYYSIDKNENQGSFVTGNINGNDSLIFYAPKFFIGPALLLEINSKNNQVLPTRGAKINAYAKSLFGLNESSYHTTQMGIDIAIFMSFAPETRFVFGTRFGAGHNIGKFEFPQAQYLSGTTNLRGYRRNRFAGRTMVFNNSEFRIRIADLKTYLFPGATGLLVFHDIGRVWADNEKSGRWHNGYGAGIWISPIKRFVLTGSLAFSKEESALPLITLGFLF